MNECEKILGDFSASFWLKQALASALERDPVDALADAEVLSEVLRERLDRLCTQLYPPDLITARIVECPRGCNSHITKDPTPECAACGSRMYEPE